MKKTVFSPNISRVGGQTSWSGLKMVEVKVEVTKYSFFVDRNLRDIFISLFIRIITLIWNHCCNISMPPVISFHIEQPLNRSRDFWNKNYKIFLFVTENLYYVCFLLFILKNRLCINYTNTPAQSMCLGVSKKEKKKI